MFERYRLTYILLPDTLRVGAKLRTNRTVLVPVAVPLLRRISDLAKSHDPGCSYE